MVGVLHPPPAGDLSGERAFADHLIGSLGRGATWLMSTELH